MAGGGLWERESEVSALGGAVAAAAKGAGQLVLVEGPAGIGKSRLLAVARSLAAGRDMRVLAARGMELEREVPFGLARQLFVPSLLRASAAERASLLAGPARLAEPLLGGLPADAQVGEGQAGALIEGLHWLAVNFAQAGTGGSLPGCLAIVVDDAQWADRRPCASSFTTAGRTLDALGLVSPGFLPWRSCAALAAIHAGHGEQAAGLIAEELALARRAGNSRAAGIALRAGGLIAGGDEAITLLSDSVQTLEATSGRLELARSLTELGSAQRRSGQRSAARPVLRRALDIAASCGAQVLAARARTELQATGSRPRRAQLSGIESLTPAERRIAELAGHGRTNTEIAHALFVTTKTVEWHLANAFRKLGITSRRDLGTALPPRDIPSCDES